MDDRMLKKVVYRITPKEEWERSLSVGYVPQGAIDQKDGFIHLSTEETLLETANLYFSREEHPIALEIAASSLGSRLQWDRVPSRGNKTFPHFYGERITLKAVVALVELVPDFSGRYQLGERQKR